MSTLARNQIPCTAQRLGQLRDEMIQAVVPGSAFAYGRKYFSERRVRIIQADDAKISSEVEGTSGVYQQTIRLTAGTLVAKCSCPSREAPLCRHCVAVLLEYIRLSPQGEQGTSKTRPAQNGFTARPAAMYDHVPGQDGPASGPAPTSSALGFRFDEVTIFLQWMPEAVTAVKAGTAPPAAPDLGPGEILEWVQTLRQLAEHARQSDESLMDLRGELSAQEDRMAGLTRDLESANRQAKEYQAACDELKLELERQRVTVNRLVTLDQERDKLAHRFMDMASEMVKRAADLDRLAADWGNLSGGKQPPPGLRGKP
jgi:hypothetical protein